MSRWWAPTCPTRSYESKKVSLVNRKPTLTRSAALMMRFQSPVGVTEPCTGRRVIDRFHAAMRPKREERRKTMRGRSLFLCLTFLRFVQWGSCVDPYPASVAYNCNPKFPFPPMAAPDATSVIQTNIDKVVAQLIAKVTPSGFTTTSTGSGASTIYGLLQCRADVNAKDCTACGKGAQREINDRCAKDGKARFWFDRCFLRYDTENFIGKLDRMDYYVTDNYAGNASNPKVFMEKVRKLMGEVTAMAVVPGKGALGKGRITVSPKVTLYGMAECTRDLAPSVCSGCLATAVSKFRQCCVGKERGRVLFGSCNVHYEIYPFF